MATRRITVPEGHVAIVMSREDAHRLNSVVISARRRLTGRSRRSSLVDPHDDLAMAAFILGYAEAILEPDA